MNLLAYVHLRNIHDSTGAGRVARLLTENLGRLPGVSLRILADANDHKKIIPLVGAPWDSYRYHLFEKDTSRQQAEWFFLRRPKAESFWPEAEVTFCTAESFVPTKTSRLAVTLHDAAYFEREAHSPGLSRAKQRYKWKLLYGTLARRADLFHTVSHFSAERLAHYFPAIRNRLRVVHNAVPPRFFAPPSPAGKEFLRKHDLETRPFLFLPAGLRHRKNAAVVLRAWPMLRRSHPGLLLVTTQCDAAYVRAARTFGDSVLFTGFIDDEALCSLYHAARVVWFPSLYEGFGLPVLESMACGTPVVASDASSLPEVAGQSALLVPPSAPAEHAAAIGALLDDGSLRSRLVRDGLSRARQFTWDLSAAKLREHFDVLAGRSVSSPKAVAKGKSAA